MSAHDPASSVENANSGDVSFGGITWNLKKTLASVVVSFLVCSVAIAQEGRGSISGIVTDASGGTLVGAQSSRLTGFLMENCCVGRADVHRSQDPRIRAERGNRKMQGRYNVLFLCTGNSARSIMAEAILNHRGRPNFAAYSAGSHPSGKVRPEAIKILEEARLPTEKLRSKSWDEFAKPGAPHLNFVFTVCDNAAKETCPLWPGQPMTAHWGVPDPAAVAGSPEQLEKAFREAFMILDRRINLFLCLPLTSLDQLAIKKEIDRIGSEWLSHKQCA